MRTHFIVTNIDKTPQRVMDWQGQMRIINPGKSILMHNPPKESYTFHIEPLTREAEKAYFEEFKTEGEEIKTVAEVKAEKPEKKLKTQEVKKI
jgi:hypothetical protein